MKKDWKERMRERERERETWSYKYPANGAPNALEIANTLPLMPDTIDCFRRIGVRERKRAKRRK